MLRHTRYDVDLDAVAHNFRRVREIVGSEADSAAPKAAVVLKADAYGLGAVPVARVLLREGADMLAVACLPEAVQLRRAFPDAPILVMGHTPDEYFPEAVRERVTCTIFDYAQAEALSTEAARAGVTAVAHVKVDTGMNRLGLKPELFEPGTGAGSAAGLLARMACLPSLALEGVFTHLALNDEASDAAQFATFMRLLDGAAALGVRFAIRHVCDSIGLMKYPEYRLDMVRPGAVMYGVTPLDTPLTASADIRTPFRLSTRISRIRPMAAGEGVGYDYTFRAPPGGTLLATLPVGYADGYKRCLSNVASVLVRGRRAPVVGLVCMDQCTVDVGGVPGVREGDEVVLLGGDRSDRPGEGIPVLEMAGWAKTNRNDVICSIGRRVPRVYLEGGRPAVESDFVLGGTV
ncbi:MAG: alanine racemase [Spirochaetae bacterium HGW-Spirochaetae-3]|jgi:alanine racemase|nr:MAG: alanine racemase [Spirochaetae bacterium HGW-Spirochaetae-3]